MAGEAALLDAERRLLGILIRHPEMIDEAVDSLLPDHFQEPSHRVVFEGILELYHRRGQVSYTHLYEHLLARDVPAPEEVLLPLTESFISEKELGAALELLRRSFQRRQLLAAAREIERMVTEEQEASVEELQARAQELIFQATTGSGAGEEDVKDLLSVLNKCYARLVARRSGRAAYGLPVRYPSVDLMTTGFKKKDLIVLAARPSMGKTSLALNFAVNVAKRNVPVLIFSLEMDDEQIGDRIVISELFRYRNPRGEFEVTAEDYATRLDDAKMALAERVFGELHKLPIFVVDRRGLTAAEIRAKARKVKAARPDLGLIIIDYLQLIRPPAHSGNRNWALVVGEMVRELRDLAGELDLPLLLLSQLNRGVESRENKRPQLSDLRDSGNIEEFADVVMMLYREDYYDPEGARERGTEGQVEVIFAKQRKGRTGRAFLRWIPQFTRFIDEAPPELAGEGA